MLYKALKVDKLREENYCQKTDEKFLRKLNEEKPESLKNYQKYGMRHKLLTVTEMQSTTKADTMM